MRLVTWELALSRCSHCPIRDQGGCAKQTFTDSSGHAKASVRIAWLCGHLAQKRGSMALLGDAVSGGVVAKKNPVCAQWCIFSIVRANAEKYDLCSAPIARTPPRYIVLFFNT